MTYDDAYLLEYQKQFNHYTNLWMKAVLCEPRAPIMARLSWHQRTWYQFLRFAYDLGLRRQLLK